MAANNFIAITVVLFILAGLCEILRMWKWLRDAQPLWCGLAGAAILILYAPRAATSSCSIGDVKQGEDSMKRVTRDFA